MSSKHEIKVLTETYDNILKEKDETILTVKEMNIQTQNEYNKLSLKSDSKYVALPT